VVEVLTVLDEGGSGFAAYLIPSLSCDNAMEQQRRYGFEE
jgi:hypothetical protein